VSAPETTPTPSAELVNAGVASACRRRRVSEASRHFWRAAPVVAAVSLGLAAISLWVGWTAILALGVLALGFAGLTVYTLVCRRDRAVTDTAAAGIDRDAGLGGELRSAAWFAGSANRDIWTDFHLDRAAARLDTVNWLERYPAARAPRAKLATSVMVIAALGLSIAMTNRVHVGSSPFTDKTLANAPKNEPRLGNGQPLPPELLKLLADLLAAAESGDASAAATLAASAELRELLSQLGELRDSAALRDLARAMEANAILSSDRAKEMALAERTKHAADMEELSPEIREALEKMSENLTEAAASEQAVSDEAAGAANALSPEQAKAGTEEASTSIQTLKDADAGSGASVMMMSNDGQPGSAAGVGIGGGSAGENGGGTMPDIERALRQETVEASADNTGQNVLTNTRRKTESGRATTTFTQGAAGAFDRSRAAAPPPVPEGRRSAVQTYFIRKP
jgi:hypothetical protein